MESLQDILDLVNEAEGARSGLQALLVLGNEVMPTDFWDGLRTLRPEPAVRSARRWIESQIPDDLEPGGLVFFLDPRPEPIDVPVLHLAVAEGPLPDDLDDPLAWVEGATLRPRAHAFSDLEDPLLLAEGLDDERDQVFVEYLLGIGYVGVVLQEALIDLIDEHPTLEIALGFHDGDLVLLD